MGSRLGWAVYRLFTTRDDRQVFIAITSNAHWARFCAEFGLRRFLGRTRRSTRTPGARQPRPDHPAHRGDRPRLTAAELVERLERIHVPFAPLNTPLDVLATST